jgi:hypothetical protein
MRSLSLAWVICGAITFFVLSASSVSLAEPVRFACEGEMSLQNAGGETTEKRLLSLVIDQAEGTVTVDNYGTVPILGQSDEALSFMAKPGARDGVSTGLINRFTGAAWVHIISPYGLLKFDGRCKPAKRLF